MRRVHPIAGLGLPLIEVSRRAGVDRVSLSQVVHGHRNRVGIEAMVKLCAAFPGALTLEELATWSWASKRRRSV